MNHVILFNSPYFKIIIFSKKKRKEKALEQQFSVLDSMSVGGKGQYFKYLISAEACKNGGNNIFLRNR